MAPKITRSAPPFALETCHRPITRSRPSNSIQTVCAVLFIALSSGSVVGCGSPDPVSQPTQHIDNLPDHFSLVAIGLRESFATSHYVWSNTGPACRINQTQLLTAGDARLVIKDASGTIVYDASLNRIGNLDSGFGGPGFWQLTLILTDASGDLAFTVETSAPDRGPPPEL